MEDVLTEIPPPSRFFQEDLNNFTPPSPPLPSPFLVFPTTADLNLPLRPSLLIIAVSSPSLHLFHSAASKSLIGTLILPETSFSGNSVHPSLKDNSCNLYSLNSQTLLVSVQLPVAADRCHAVAKLLISDQIVPERVLILDSVQNQNFRGRLSRDEAVAFKLETTSERKSESKSMLKDLRLEYLPSASVVDGLGAAVLARCEIKNVKAVLCVSWPEYGPGVVELIKSKVLAGMDVGMRFETDGGDYGGLRHDKDPFDSDLYC